jgi:hypothetical protein
MMSFTIRSQDHGSSGSSRGHPWWLRLALLAAIGIGLEGTAATGLYLLQRTRGVVYQPLAVSSISSAHRDVLTRLLEDRTEHFAYSASLGWTLKPNSTSGAGRSNAAGLRAGREYTRTPPPGTTRIATFGDSFTYGGDVRDHETWQVALESAVPGTEVLNFGVSAYGLDQAYLRWVTEGRHYEPSVVLIGYYSENLGRHVGRYRPFYRPTTVIPLAKPRFTLGGDGLVLMPNPAASLDDYRRLLAAPHPTLRRFGTGDYYFEHTPHASTLDWSAFVRLAKLARHELLDAPTTPMRDGRYNERSEAYALTRGLFDRFVADVRRAGMVPMIVVFPTRDDFGRRAAGRAPAYGALLADFTAKGYDYVDVLAAFPDCLSACDLNAVIPAHFSPEGNAVIGGFIGRALRARGFIRP